MGNNLEMKAEPTFIKDRSPAEEDTNEEKLLSEREKSLNVLVLKLLSFLTEIGQGGHWSLLFLSL